MINQLEELQVLLRDLMNSSLLVKSDTSGAKAVQTLERIITRLGGEPVNKSKSLYESTINHEDIEMREMAELLAESAKPEIISFTKRLDEIILKLRVEKKAELLVLHCQILKRNLNKKKEINKERILELCNLIEELLS